MPLYEYKCEKCQEVHEVFYRMDDDHPAELKCHICGCKAIRLFTTGAAYVKKKRLGDVWDEAGVTPKSTPHTKAANAERIRKMREQARIDIERCKRTKDG